MSGDAVKVNFAEITNAGGTIGSQAQQLQQLLDDLKQRVTSTLAGWEGSAQGAYKEAQDKWDRSAADIQQVLASVSTAVNQASEAYSQAEQRNAGRW